MSFTKKTPLNINIYIIHRFYAFVKTFEFYKEKDRGGLSPKLTNFRYNYM